MNVLVAIVLGLGMGAVFGIALEKSRVFEPGAIVNQMQLRTFLMLKIFLTAGHHRLGCAGGAARRLGRQDVSQGA